MTGKKKKGKFFITVGLLLIVAALDLTGYNLYEGYQAQKASDEFVAGIDLDLSAGVKPPWYSDQEMPTVEVDGFEFIGMLSIPSENLLLPVMKDWSYTGLSVSPCRYTGSYFQNDMVVCAHNFAKHFAALWSIEPGTDVYFMNVEGLLYHYQVSNRETIDPYNIFEMIVNKNNIDDYLEQKNGNNASQSDDEAGDGMADAPANVDAEDWDLCLFTCNLGGQTRCAVRCTRIRE